MSRVHVLEEFQPQKPEPLTEKFELEKPEPLWNSSLKYLHCWGIPALKTLPKPLRNSSIKNLNHWGIPASKTWTCEELQTQILTLGEFQPQKYWYFRNSSLNCYPWGILGSKILTPEEFQSDYFGIYPWRIPDRWHVNGYPGRILGFLDGLHTY